jgi:hypothetical protein
MNSRIYRCFIDLPEGRRLVWNDLTQTEACELYRLLLKRLPAMPGFDKSERVEIEWGVMP